MTKIKEIIRAGKKKIVNIATNKAIITVAIFFYLALILIRTKEKNYGQAIEHGNDAINILRCVPVAAIPAAAAAVEGTAAAAAGGTAAAAGGTTAAAATGEAAAGGLEAANAANAARTGTQAVKTGSDVAKGADTANKAAGAVPKSVPTTGGGGGGGAPAPKSTPTVKASEAKTNPHLNQEQVKPETTNKLDKESSSLKDKMKRMDDLNQQVGDDKKNKDRMAEETEENADQETEMDVATKSVVGKPTLPKIIIGVVIASFLGLVFGISLIAILPYLWVNQISTIVDGVSKIADRVGDEIGKTLESLKNAFFLRGFRTDEKILYDEITKQYDIYLNAPYSVEIDIPLISATLFYDIQSVDPIDQTDTNGDNLPDVSSKVKERLSSVADAAALQVQMYENRFLCSSETTDGVTTYKKTFLSSYPVEMGPPRPDSVCTADTVGQEIYEHSYQIDLDNYYKKLQNSGILEKIYGNEAKTEAQRNSLASAIRSSRDLWVLLYLTGKEKKDCPSTGTIPGAVLDEMQAPIKEPYTITSYFGYRVGGSIISGNHTGIDAVPTTVVNIYAVGDGIVTRSNKETTGGNVVEITHTLFGQRYVSQYAHMADGTIVVTEGQAIKKGDMIGVMGQTGKVTGPHLHFQMWKEGLITHKGYSSILDDILNPVNLFEAASNYIYECKKKASTQDCSLEGSVASIAQQKSYNFNILRAIVQYESSSSDSDVLTIGFKVEDLKARLAAVTSSEATTVSSQINFDDKLVYINGAWIPFGSSAAQVARNKVVQLIASVNEKVYLDIAMGNGQIKGSNYKTIGYNSAEEMYEDFSKSKYAQIKGMIAYLENQGSAVINVLKNIGAMTDSQLDGAVQTLVEAYRPGGPETWKANVLSNYRKFRDDPNSKIENYIGQCTTVIENPEWEVCSTYENKSGCKSNLSKYKEKANELISKATTSTGKRVLTNALSLWGYVRYCGGNFNPLDDNDGNYEIRCSLRYGPVHYYYGQGFRDAWKITHNYTYGGRSYTAGVAGLDCGGFVTWVMNQTFETKLTYVLYGGCTRDTSYTKVVKFSVGGFSSIAKDLKPGDVICDPDKPTDHKRHTIIYMGFDDSNGNGYPDGNEMIYQIHTGSGSLGVEIKGYRLNSGKFDRYWSYFTYK